jgi:hypothetical protein
MDRSVKIVHGEKRNMRSSQDSAGIKLLNKWKTKLESTNRPTSVRLSFTGVVTFTGVGVIVFFDDSELRVSGVGFDLSLNLEDALFENTVSEEHLRSIGADPAFCGEGTDIVAEWGTVNLTTFGAKEEIN